jgi:hypothetical protein
MTIIWHILFRWNIYDADAGAFFGSALRTLGHFEPVLKKYLCSLFIDGAQATGLLLASSSLESGCAAPVQAIFFVYRAKSCKDENDGTIVVFKSCQTNV